MGSLPKVSVLIAFRNEDSRIQALLDSLNALNYPKDKLEIIFVDDHSDDQAAERIRNFAAQKNLNLAVLSLPEGKAGKKAALALARQNASSEYLFFTDADVTLPSSWLKNMLFCQQNSNAEMVCGEVEVVYRRGLFNIFEALEQAALVAFSASSIAAGKVFLCNGSGYLLKKQALEKLVLPEDWQRSPGGDDVMLLHAMHKAGEKIAYCRIEGSRVQIEPTGSKEFLQQRIRWGSKVFLGNPSGNRLPAMLVWLFHLLNVWLFGNLLLQSGIAGPFLVLLTGFFFRGLWESALLHDFVSPSLQKFTPGWGVKKDDCSLNAPENLKYPNPMLLAVLCSMLAPFYSIYVVLAGPVLLIFRSFTWKGRVYPSA